MLIPCWCLNLNYKVMKSTYIKWYYANNIKSIAMWFGKIHKKIKCFFSWFTKNLNDYFFLIHCPTNRAIVMLLLNGIFIKLIFLENHIVCTILFWISAYYLYICSWSNKARRKGLSYSPLAFKSRPRNRHCSAMGAVIKLDDVI